jgi:cell division protein FtsW (lipid II flippase)
MGKMTRTKKMVPLLLVLLVNLIGFGILFFIEGEIDKTFLYYSAALLAIVIVSYGIILIFSLGDEYLFLIVSMLLTIGIITLFRLSGASALKQIIWFYVGMGGFYMVYFTYRSFKFWSKIPLVYIVISVLLFLATLVMGDTVSGSKNWITLGEISVQPSEIIKILLVLTLSAMYSAPYEEDKSGNIFARLFSSPQTREFLIMGVVYVHLGFLVLQREWGSALLYFLIYFFMQYVFGSKKIYIAINIFFAAVGGLAGALSMPHIQQRIAIWKDPFADAGDLGYQIVQSLYAMASGGFTGSGIGQGSPYLIPVVKSDFIFSAIYEEMGMLGATAVVMLFFLFVYRGVKIALRVTNTFNKAVAFGLSVMIGFQTFIIIGGVIKLIPLTGITLPFMSAGGSSLAASFAALAILESISSKTEEMTDDI